MSMRSTSHAQFLAKKGVLRNFILASDVECNPFLLERPKRSQLMSDPDIKITKKKFKTDYWLVWPKKLCFRYALEYHDKL